nr:NAC domain-containing protein [Tanacetum cinerariifolium]
MNDLVSDDESVDTPLVSLFPHSDNDSDDGEVLDELIEYENVLRIENRAKRVFLGSFRSRVLNIQDQDKVLKIPEHAIGKSYDDESWYSYPEPNSFIYKKSDDDIVVTLAYTPPLPFLATMDHSDTFLMGNKVISTPPERENDEFIKSSVDDLVPIPRESEVTSVFDDIECGILLDSPSSPRLDVLGEIKVDIDLPFGEHLDTLLMGDREIDFNHRDIETNDLIHVPIVFDEPLGNSNSVSRTYDVTFSNPLFNFNDDYTLCYDNPLFDEEFEDISSLDPPEPTLVIDDSSLLVTPPPASKQLSLREVERFAMFFSLT